MTQRLKGKIAFVMGAGCVGEGWGNGKATAVLFARQGAHVVGTDLDLAAAEETQRIIREEGHSAEVHALDVTNGQVTGDFLRAVRDQHGAVDILVNNVGRSEPGGPVEMSEEVWAAQFQLNATTAFLACKHVIPIMQKQGGGAIVNTASAVANIGIHGRAAYVASKGAVAALTRAMATDHVDANIRINAVAPGTIESPYFAKS